MELSLDWILATFVSALVGGLLGGGVIWALAYRALKDKLIGDLKEIFARKSELNAWGDRVNGLETVIVSTRDRADQNADNVIRLQQVHENRWKPLERTLERISDRLDKQENLSARTLALLESLEKRMDRHQDGQR